MSKAVIEAREFRVGGTLKRHAGACCSMGPPIFGATIVARGAAGTSAPLSIGSDHPPCRGCQLRGTSHSVGFFEPRNRAQEMKAFRPGGGRRSRHGDVGPGSRPLIAVLSAREGWVKIHPPSICERCGRTIAACVENDCVRRHRPLPSVSGIVRNASPALSDDAVEAENHRRVQHAPYCADSQNGRRPMPQDRRRGATMKISARTACRRPWFSTISGFNAALVLHNQRRHPSAWNRMSTCEAEQIVGRDSCRPR